MKRSDIKRRPLSDTTALIVIPCSLGTPNPNGLLRNNWL